LPCADIYVVIDPDVKKKLREFLQAEFPDSIAKHLTATHTATD
jgi:hypothetical protein